MTGVDIACKGCLAHLAPEAANFRITTPRLCLVFCKEDCAKTWALSEVVRLAGWLSKITIRARGLGRSLAMSALYSNTQASR